MSQSSELDTLLARINELKSEEVPVGPVQSSSPASVAVHELGSPTVQNEVEATPGPVHHEPAKPAGALERPCDSADDFIPLEPETFEEAGIPPVAAENLMIKFLFNCGEATGQMMSDQAKLPFTLISKILPRLKNSRLIEYRGTAALNDYVCQLTDLGRERAQRLVAQCTYFGSAPVPFEKYVESINRQSLQHQHPTREDLARAFSDLLINPAMFTKIGAAANSGRGMFLYGFPGNGKTSIAERLTKCFGEFVWIPRAVVTDGEIIRIFDPSQHEAAPLTEEHAGLLHSSRIDGRWIRIRRPTIIVGGELTMEHLELRMNPVTGINEAPLQMKSNCGTLVIDDFGRQRMTTDELLNRWIVPLEKRYDFLNLPSGKKIEVPFDQLVVFSTNLEPRDLVDDAFLRRIPYKIEVEDPTEAEFRQLFRIMCPHFEIEYKERAIDYLVKRHYEPADRPFRCCHPRDILLQIHNYCMYERKPKELTRDSIDFAVENYFSVM